MCVISLIVNNLLNVLEGTYTGTYCPGLAISLILKASLIDAKRDTDFRLKSSARRMHIVEMFFEPTFSICNSTKTKQFAFHITTVVIVHSLTVRLVCWRCFEKALRAFHSTKNSGMKFRVFHGTNETVFSGLLD